MNRPGTQSRRPSNPSVEQQARAKRMTNLTKLLADLMIEQLQKGRKEKNTQGRMEWNFICDEFCRRTTLAWDKEQLQNRRSILNKQYLTVKSTLRWDDFEFHERTRTIVATEEAWNEYFIVYNADAS